MHPADRLRQAVAGYPLEVLSNAIAAVLHMELVGARLVALWLLEARADIASRRRSRTCRWTRSWRGYAPIWREQGAYTRRA